MRLAKLLRYAAVQFLALVGAAMLVYPGGTFWDVRTPRYEFTGNFLSDLGATRTWSGAPNTASMALFALALASIGAALIAFAWDWKRHAFAHRRAAAAGWASAAFGTGSGACFIGVACTPLDKALAWHNGLVLAAFGFLLLYVVAIAIAMARNGASRIINTINSAYVLIVLGYVLLVIFGPRLGTSEHAFRVQVVGQKIVALASMLHVIALTTALSSAGTSSSRPSSRPSRSPR